MLHDAALSDTGASIVGALVQMMCTGVHAFNTVRRSPADGFQMPNLARPATADAPQASLRKSGPQNAHNHVDGQQRHNFPDKRAGRQPAHPVLHKVLSDVKAAKDAEHRKERPVHHNGPDTVSLSLCFKIELTAN